MPNGYLVDGLSVLEEGVPVKLGGPGSEYFPEPSSLLGKFVVIRCLETGKATIHRYVKNEHGDGLHLELL